jgi:hypothetical protein
VAGFASFEDRSSTFIENYQHRLRMCRLLTQEVNAAVWAAKACGAKIIYVNVPVIIAPEDWHIPE